MRFLNSDAIGITIKNRQEKTQAQFKAYLEKSDVEYKIQEYVMPNSNIGEGRTHEVLKVVYNILLDFNVIAEYEEEAVENYDKLHLLLHYIKPVISSKGVHKEITLNPDFVKSNDRLYINFKGLPKILNDKIYELKADGTIDLSSNPDLTQNDIPIQIFGFSYSINKELGYIQMPNSKEERKQGKKYSSSGVTLFPIGFKISMQCRVVADLEYLANVQYNLFEIDPVTGDRKEINLNTILPSYRNEYKNYLKSYYLLKLFH